MKFGLESEKFIFNIKKNRPSRGVFRFVDALSDYEHFQGQDITKSISNEFVLNMVEFGTKPSHSPMEVLKEYLFHYLLLQSVAAREDVAIVSLGALPMKYEPHMTPKWAYYVQNSILDNKKQASWMMNTDSPLLAAGNCAGVHVHVELKTPPEFLFSNRELQDKFNMGLMMTPMIAFSSSPYFFGAHEGLSMRGIKYYQGVYKNFPLNGGLPPVMNSSQEALKFVLDGISHWIALGAKLGFPKEELQRLTSKKGANWSPVRWNRSWNTIELRCLESDRIDLDGSKFIWVSGAMKRMDLLGEALKCEVIKTSQKLDEKMITDAFQVSGGRVSILPGQAIAELFQRGMLKGTRDPLVEQYLHQLAAFASKGIHKDDFWAFKILKRTLDNHQTTSERLLEQTGFKTKISEKRAIELMKYSIEDQNKVIKTLKKYVPDVFKWVDEASARII